uniref:GPI transamidase component PIG-S n=1 Tax=Strongyloides venezuelensis TaxID=75913 RepID=A0A0K0F6D5_STRVS
MTEESVEIKKKNEEFLKSPIGISLKYDKKICKIYFIILILLFFGVWYETTKVQKANIISIENENVIRSVARINIFSSFLSVERRESIGKMLTSNLNSEKLVDNINFNFFSIVNESIKEKKDDILSFSFNLIPDEKWEYFTKYVVFLDEGNCVNVKYTEYMTNEEIFKRLKSLIVDVLIDTHLIDILMKRETGKIINSKHLEYMSPKYQNRYIWDSTTLANRYNVQVIIIRDSLKRKRNNSFERDIEKALTKFGNKLSDSVKLSITVENLYGINIDNFLETDITGKKYLKIGSKVENLMSVIDQQLSGSLSIDPQLKLILLENSGNFVFINEHGDDENNVIAAGWGSLFSYTPSITLDNNSEEYANKLKDVTTFLFGSLKTLLGIHSDLLSVYQKTKVPLADWEIQKFKLRFYVDKVLSTIYNIKSTHALIEKVENMEISESVANKMNEAIYLLKKSLRDFEKTGTLKLDEISKAAELSEIVVSDPTLVSLLYFPSDQKIGVYLPIALPAVFPVILSIYSFYDDWKKKDK